jgi:hypothetical protein
MKVACAFAYLVGMGLYFYAWKKDVVFEPPLDWLVFAGLGVFQLVIGAMIGRWWALALPFAAVLLAVPFGYGEGLGQEAPIWLYFGFLLSVPAAIIVSLGVGARRLLARRAVE